jgi:hypothetical protein
MGLASSEGLLLQHLRHLPFRRPSDPTPQERRDGVEPFDGWAVNGRRGDVASAPFHYALAPRFKRQRAAAELRR